ncbi:MAG: M3 family oligoendopeptidase [Bradymonadaceae bacterium]|nr:M3 family oligoendopeptidase [Lujinxingiaceae bacterium]
MSTTTKNFPTSNPSWDTESIFEGGVESQSFRAAVDQVVEDLAGIRERAKALVSPSAVSFGQADQEAWVSVLLDSRRLQDRVNETGSFSWFMASTHTDDPRALRLPSLLNDASTQLRAMSVDVQAKLRGLSDAQFSSLHGLEALSSMDLLLREMRRDADASMEPALEALAVELNRDGLHAWGELYSQVSARMEVQVEQADGTTRTMSVGQAKNMAEDGDREVRRRAFEGLAAAWAKVAPVSAQALSGIIGSQQSVYRRRGGDALTEPLNANRISRKTVDAMHEAADAHKALLVEYMGLKAQYLGLEKLAWYDLHAPVGATADQEKISYEQAQRFIVTHVGSFSERIAEFCRHALASQWVEVEDRAGKAQGGYCSTLPVSKQIRIFMTFGGTPSGVQTLAHELGHGYHAWVMRNMASSEQQIPMTLAETASTLAEALVEEAALKQAHGSDKLRLLDDRLRRAIAFLIDVPARYRLEHAMHEKRAEGPLDEENLTEMTRAVFGEAFGGGLESVDGLFWTSKLHFYLTSAPFYNFPYTFGYLFSKALYARAEAEGPTFARVVDSMLEDTGRMTVEELASQYLGVDLTQTAFWAEAAGSVASDVAQYRKLVQEQMANRK